MILPQADNVSSDCPEPSAHSPGPPPKNAFICHSWDSSYLQGLELDVPGPHSGSGKQKARNPKCARHGNQMLGCYAEAMNKIEETRDQSRNVS